jgi:aldehyde:ferredoxin oxidoreductase
MVLYGYAGKMLFVDLSTGSIQERPLEEKVARDFLGGYGLGRWWAWASTTACATRSWASRR